MALQTDDLRLYHRLVPIFESQGIPLLGLTLQEDVPATVQVLLDGPDADTRSVPVRTDDEATLLAVLQRLDDRPTSTEPDGYRHVVFGVDPGNTIGLAVVADGQALMVAQEHDPVDAIRRLARWKDGLSAESWSLHMGDGAPEVGVVMRSIAPDHLPDAHFVLVHESRTTPKAPVTGSRHMDAAVLIALRSR